MILSPIELAHLIRLSSELGVASLKVGDIEVQFGHVVKRGQDVRRQQEADELSEQAAIYDRWKAKLENPSPDDENPFADFEEELVEDLDGPEEA